MIDVNAFGSLHFFNAVRSVTVRALGCSDYPRIKFFMAALRCRCGHYIFGLFLSFFFPRLISAVGDWMSTILPHMVWTYCKFRMHVLNVLHAAH